jgi:Right handed beta helix region
MALAMARRRPVALAGVLLFCAVLLFAALRAGDDRDGSASVELAAEQLSGAAAVVDDPDALGGSFVRLAGPSGRGAAPCRGIEVRPGADLGAAVAASPEGATLCLRSGVHRVSEPVRPKDRQRLVGQPGTVVSGARVVTGFTRSGRDHVAAAFLPRDPSTHGECATPGCTYPQDVFLGGVPLTRVLDLDDLEAGRFYQDFRTNRLYLRDDPDGRVVEQAHAPSILWSAARDVTVRGLVVEKAANEAQRAAIDNEGGGGWAIEDNEVRYNHGVGIRGDSSTVRGNVIHHNGQLGLSGHGDGSLVEGNEIAWNNTAGYYCLWECGGTKWAENRGLVVRGNWSHDNLGPGMWTDINNVDVVYEDNVVTGNQGYGILHEISYRATIRGNVVQDTRPYDDTGFFGGGEIVVSASPDVEVYGNEVRGAVGIGILQQRRVDFPSPLGPHEARNVHVRDNTVTATDPSAVVAGMATDVPGLDDPRRLAGRNNRFTGNRYHLPQLSGRWFDWLGDRRTAEEWRGYGQDVTGTFRTVGDAERGGRRFPSPAMGVAGSAVAEVSVPLAGTYRIWSRVGGQGGRGGSWLVEVDGGQPVPVDTGGGGWTWVDHRHGDPGSKLDVHLNAGRHVLRLTGRGAGIGLDRVILTTDRRCVPVGDGDNCA